MSHFKYWYFSSPLGDIEIKFDDNFIYALNFVETNQVKINEANSANKTLSLALEQIQNYFSGNLKSFDLPLKLNGTEFQNRVWTELLNIPYGKTISYLSLAKKLGDEKCIRAAASANGKNPFLIIVPCHRVIGSDGSLTGYSGGFWRKQWLLEHEAKKVGTHNKLF